MINFLKKLCFERLGGSPEEHKAARLIIEDLKPTGLTPRIQKFKVNTFKPGKATLNILKPHTRAINANPIGFTGSHSVRGPLEFAETGADEFLKGKENTLILLSQKPDYQKYKSFATNKIGGFIVVDRPFYPLAYPAIYHSIIREFGAIPGIIIPYQNALEIIDKPPKMAELISEQKEYEGNSRNIIYEIKGFAYPEQEIVIGAHFDSVATSPGAYDNNAGVVEVIELIKYFVRKPLPRTLKFIFFGSEELGLLGSSFYVSKLQSPDRIKLMVNLDLGGTILGRNGIIVSANQEAFNFIEGWAKIQAMDIKVTADIYSSDCMPFIDKGVPALNFYRTDLSGSGHSSHDIPCHLSNNALQYIINSAIVLLTQLGSAPDFPIARPVSAEITKKTTEYFNKRRGPNYEAFDE
ncbi:Zn-dependent exopeptidase M28 [bacterium]|nr:Zn-dependent exopeptidase M28 [bacterium]